MAAEGVLHDLGVIAMLSSDSQGMGRIGEVYRRALQNADAMKAVRGGEAGPGDNARVLRHLAKVTINPAITHGLARHVGSLEVGKLADAVLWWPQFAGVRPELVLKSGISAWGASGDGNATTTLCRAGARAPPGRRRGRARRRGSRSPSWPARRWTPSCPTTRPRARGRGLPRADGGRHGAQLAHRRRCGSTRAPTR